MSNTSEPIIKLGKPLTAIIFGSFVEWYDFFLVASAAALVFPTVFFSHLSPSVALAAGTIAFGIIFLTRPIGAIIFGHFGDRLGRISMLMWTLGLQGACVLAIGLTPVLGGNWSFVYIIIFRAIQGLGLGGEWGGGATWLLELASTSKRRGFITSLSYSTVGFASALATGLFALIAAVGGESVFLSYGWRIPFYIGVIVALIGVVIRYRMPESPTFEQAKKRKEIAKYPFGLVMKKHWLLVLSLALTLSYTFVVLSGIISPFTLKYMNSVLNISIVSALLFGTVAGVAQSTGALLGGFISDLIGRRRIMIIGVALTFVFVPFYFGLLNTMVIGLIVVAMFLLPMLTQIYTGVTPAFFSESFPTNMRYSGGGFSYQLGGFIGGALIVFVIPAIEATRTLKGDVLPITVMAEAFIAVSLIILFFLKDTWHVPLEEDQSAARSNDIKNDGASVNR